MDIIFISQTALVFQTEQLVFFTGTSQLEMISSLNILNSCAKYPEYLE